MSNSMINPDPDDIPVQRRSAKTVISVDKLGTSLESVEEKVTEITLGGDVTTRESHQLLLVEGEIVDSVRTLTGVCQHKKCGKPLTARTFRPCEYCGTVYCITHCRWIEIEEMWLCRRCKWRLHWKWFGRSLLTPILGEPEPKRRRR